MNLHAFWWICIKYMNNEYIFYLNVGEPYPPLHSRPTTVSNCTSLFLFILKVGQLYSPLLHWTGVHDVLPGRSPMSRRAFVPIVQPSRAQQQTQGIPRGRQTGPNWPKWRSRTLLCLFTTPEPISVNHLLCSCGLCLRRVTVQWDVVCILVRNAFLPLEVVVGIRDGVRKHPLLSRIPISIKHQPVRCRWGVSGR